jgi:hypothetical protein
MAAFGRALEPHCRFREVGGQGAALGVDVADHGSGLDIAGKGCAAEPGLACHGIRLGAAPFEQGQTETRHGRAQPGRRRFCVEFDRAGHVLFDADAMF